MRRYLVEVLRRVVAARALATAGPCAGGDHRAPYIDDLVAGTSRCAACGAALTGDPDA
jgi:hypothetical protein